MPFTTTPKQFGQANPQFPSYERPGSYAIILNQKHQLAVMRSQRGSLFLPGGGIENDESREDALIREVIEEAGLKVRIDQEFVNVNEWFYEENLQRNMNKVGYFFLATIEKEAKEGKIEDYDLLWMPLEEVKAKMKFNIERYVLSCLSNELLSN